VAQANRISTTKLSDLIRDPIVRAAFQRAERDYGQAFAIPTICRRCSPAGPPSPCCARWRDGAISKTRPSARHDPAPCEGKCTGLRRRRKRHWRVTRGYWISHAPRNIFPILNGGDTSILYPLLLPVPLSGVCGRRCAEPESEVLEALIANAGVVNWAGWIPVALPEQDYCYKFRECWNPVPLPPPVLPWSNFSRFGGQRVNCPIKTHFLRRTSGLAG
jgi:hypothetical protein